MQSKIKENRLQYPRRWFLVHGQGWGSFPDEDCWWSRKNQTFGRIPRQKWFVPSAAIEQLLLSNQRLKIRSCRPRQSNHKYLSNDSTHTVYKQYCTKVLFPTKIVRMYRVRKGRKQNQTFGRSIHIHEHTASEWLKILSCCPRQLNHIYLVIDSTLLVSKR